MIDEINEVADSVNTLLVVGHEPTMSSVSIGLTSSDDTNDTALQRISEKFPTSAIALLTVVGEWKSVELNCATLVEFHVPR
jgi:phosphohistidine phosphatase